MQQRGPVVRGIKDRIWNQVPALKLPTLGKTVDIPVYVIHNGSDPEDYFFILDFEQFVERSKSGIFVRPRLKVWAGRSDFARGAFGRQFRESFAHEFEHARQANSNANKSGSGWLGWDVAAGSIPEAIGVFAAYVVLLVASSAGRVVWSALPIPRFLRGKSAAEKVENEIAETQNRVDTALAAMEVTLHKDLHRHAKRDGAQVSIQGMTRDDWPLPRFVSEHINDRKSTSWW